MTRYSAKYFEKTAAIIKKFKPEAIITLQFFQRKNNVMLAGIDEVIELLKKNTAYRKYKITYLPEKTIINNKDVVLELEGPYYLFGEYEGIIDGILARQSSLATNAYHACQVTKKPIIFMGDRADHYLNQERDGYAVALGGISKQVTDAQVKYHSGQALGTVPHALIQMFNGDLVAALKAYHQVYPQENLTALVDFNNDVISDSLKVLETFGSKLEAVRVDTSPNLVDKMFENNPQYGVTPDMIKNVRKVLDEHQGKHVKIIVSSGFDAEKIEQFEKAKAPVDIYGIGASLLKININFTADAVKINGQKLAKVGRHYKELRNESIRVS